MFLITKLVGNLQISLEFFWKSGWLCVTVRPFEGVPFLLFQSTSKSELLKMCTGLIRWMSSENASKLVLRLALMERDRFHLIQAPIKGLGDSNTSKNVCGCFVIPTRLHVIEFQMEWKFKNYCQSAHFINLHLIMESRKE